MVHAYNSGGMRSHSHHITQRWGMKSRGKRQRGCRDMCLSFEAGGAFKRSKLQQCFSIPRNTRNQARDGPRTQRGTRFFDFLG